MELLERRRLLSAAPPLYPVSLTPTVASAETLAKGDFNEDGFVDLAVTTVGEFTNSPMGVQLLINNGAGDFDASPVIQIASPRQVVSGDLDTDGHLDLLVANFSASTGAVTPATVVLWGNGDGTFSAPVEVFSDLGIGRSFSVADLDADGKSDLVVSDGAMRVHFGDGTRQIETLSILAAAARSETSLVGDFNGDSRLDVTDGATLTLLGSGDRTFTTVSSAVSTRPISSFAAVGDLNGDGRDDIVDSLLVLRPHLSNGDGTFSQRPDITIASNPSSVHGVAVADFDSDGKADLAVGLRYDYMLAFLKGNGDGTFAAPQLRIFGQSHKSWFLVTDDFDRDGAPDVALAMNRLSDARPGVTTLLNDGVTGLELPGTVGLGSRNSVATADFNGDRLPDLLSVGSGAPTVSLAVAAGVFAAPSATAMVSGNRVGVGDFNADGFADACVSNSSGTSVVIYHGMGNGTFSSAVATLTGNAFSVGDLNADGIDDLAITGSGTKIVVGTPSGSYVALGAPSSGNSAVRAGDFNGDGLADLLTVNSSGVAYVQLQQAGFTFTLPSLAGFDVRMLNTSSTLSDAVLAVGDFNADGHCDVAYVPAATQSNLSTLYIRLGSSVGPVFSAALVSGSSLTPTGVPVVADFNDDGRLDCAVPGDLSSNSLTKLWAVVVYTGQGDGTISSVDTFLLNSSARSIATSDLNQDSRLDLLGVSNQPSLPGLPSVAISSLLLNQLGPDTTGPEIKRATLNPAIGTTVSLDMSEPVSTTTAVASDFLLTNIDTSQDFTATYISARQDNTQLILNFGEGLPNGSYRLTLPANAIEDRRGNGNTLEVVTDRTFFILAGDANRDRNVNFDDLLILAANYNTSGRVFAEGDFNYDGTVNFDDLLILAARYNTSLPAAAAPIGLAAAGPTGGIPGGVGPMQDDDAPPRGPSEVLV